ncbi:hypothetical protein ACQ4PT_031911 [Festuca glaucescens]
MAAATATAAAGAVLAPALVSPLSRRAFLPLPRRAGQPVITRSLRLFVSAAPRRRGVVLVAADAADAAAAAGGADFSEEESSYEILGITPLDSFDNMKLAYKRKHKEAEEMGDEDYLAKLEKAYDTVMMQQLQYRKKGVTYGSVEVSKDIKYADNQPIVPWGPRPSKSAVKDVRINMAISAAIVVWIAIIGTADWKPLQFLCFGFFYRILQKLRVTEPPITPIYNVRPFTNHSLAFNLCALLYSVELLLLSLEYGELEGRGVRMAKRVFRALGLIFGCVFAASLGYTTALNVVEFSWQHTPRIVYYYQELIVTAAASVLLCITASYYR